MNLVPSKRVCEKFRLVYELQGAQKAIDYLSNHYGIRSMKIIVNGRKVGNKNNALYNNNVAYFRKDRINKLLVAHEFFHHLCCVKSLNMTERAEEKEAHKYARLLRKQ